MDETLMEGDFAIVRKDGFWFVADLKGEPKTGGRYSDPFVAVLDTARILQKHPPVHSGPITREVLRGYICGFYAITWDDDSVSLASVGMSANGDKWVAPLNWTGVLDPTSDEYDEHLSRIRLVKLLEIKDEIDDERA